MELRSPLSKAKGLGAAKSGSHHWWMQRVTALALIPLVIWFVYLVIKASISEYQLVDMLSSPLNAVGMILFIGVALYHGAIGFRVIIEDYVHCPCGKNFIIIAANFFTVVTAVSAILAVVYFHTGNGNRKHMNYRHLNKSGATSNYKNWEGKLLNRIQKAKDAEQQTDTEQK